MIPFVIKYHQSIYPYVSLKNDQVYYCPGINVDNYTNSADGLLRVSTFMVQINIPYIMFLMNL